MKAFIFKILCHYISGDCIAVALIFLFGVNIFNEKVLHIFENLNMYMFVQGTLVCEIYR